MFSFIETRLFTKLVLDYLSDDHYARLQEALTGPAHVLRQIAKEVEDVQG